MSRLTQKLLSGIDYNAIADIRRQNFHIFHSHLKEINKLKVNLELGAVPMTYPLMVSNGEQLKQKLIQNKVFLATYWPNVKNWVSRNSIELKLYSNLLSIPIDQRYSHIDMKKILLILNYV
jgi:hypothetical protein